VAKVPVQFSGDAQKVLREQQKVIDKQRQLISEFNKGSAETARSSDRAARSLRDAGKSRDEAFGSRGMGQLSSFAARIGIIATAASGLKKILAEVNKAREEAGARGLASESGLSSLAQLAGGNKARLQQLIGAARKTYAEGGASSLDAAAKQVFALESAGALGGRQFFSRLYGIVEDPAAMARAAATMRKSVGAKETGGFSQIVSKAFAASKYSPASAEALLTAASRGGQGIRAIGGSDEELLAATAIMATARGSAEEGGTTVAALLKQLQKKGGFEGLGLKGSLEKLKAKGLSGRKLLKFLGGRQEASIAADVLMRSIPQLDEITGAQAVAEHTNLAGRIISSREAIPEIEVARAARAARARREIGETRKGALRNVSEATFEKARAYDEAEYGEFIAGLSDVVRRSDRYLFGDEGAMSSWGTKGERQKFFEVKRQVSGNYDVKVEVTPKRSDPNAGGE